MFHISATDIGMSTLSCYRLFNSTQLPQIVVFFNLLNIWTISPELYLCRREAFQYSGEEYAFVDKLPFEAALRLGGQCYGSTHITLLVRECSANDKVLVSLGHNINVTITDLS